LPAGQARQRAVGALEKCPGGQYIHWQTFSQVTQVSATRVQQEDEQGGCLSKSVCVCVCARARECVCVFHLGGCALALVHIDDDKAVNARHIHLYPPCPPRVQSREVLIHVGGALLFSLPLLPSLSPISDSRITCRQKPLITVPLHTRAQAA